MKDNKFIKNIEQMVDPIEVGTIHFMQSFINRVPPRFQDKVITKSSKNNPYMGFVVEPYSLFLCHEIKDIELAKSLIPDGFELVKTTVVEDEIPKYYSIIGCFNVHSSAFWGTRIEFYIIAKNKQTGLVSWLIIDYDTNTVSYDKKSGLVGSNTNRCILTTNFNGDVLLDTQNKFNDRKLIVTTNIENGIKKLLSKPLWVEGNLSIGYGVEKSLNTSEVFSTLFIPKEVSSALDIPLCDVHIECNDWYKDMIDTNPTKVLCFPYAQHYLSDSPGHYTNITSEEELVSKLQDISFNEMSKYSSKSIKSMFRIGQVVSLVTIAILTGLLIVN